MTEDERLELEEQYINDIEKVIPTDKAINAILPIFDIFNYGEENPYRTEYNGIIKAFFDEIASGTTYARFLTDGFDSLRDIEFIDGMTEDDISAAISDLERKLKKFSEKLEKEMLQEKAESEKYENRIVLYNKSIKIALALIERKKNELQIQVKKLRENINKLSGSDSIKERLKSQLDQLQLLLDKTTNDYNYVKNISDYMDNTALNFMDPIKKYEQLESLNNKISDLYMTRTESGSQVLIEKLNNELKSTKSRYSAMIKETKNQNTQELLKNELNRKEEELTSRINNVSSLKALKEEDRESQIADINDKISGLNDISYDEKHKNSKDNFKDMQSTVGPLFEEKEIETFDEDNNIRITNGKSMFNYILESSDQYNRYQKRIEQLEAKMKELNIKEELAEDTMGFFTKKTIKREKKYIDIELKALKEKKIAITGNQKLILLNRNKAIQKRNEKISKYESRANLHMAKGHKLRASINSFNANWLSDVPSRNFKEKAEEHNDLGNKKRAIAYSVLSKVASKPIRVASASTILMKEELIVQLDYAKSTRNGKINKRLWQELALEEIERKASRKRKHKNNNGSIVDEDNWLTQGGEVDDGINWEDLLEAERIEQEEQATKAAGKTR